MADTALLDYQAKVDRLKTLRADAGKVTEEWEAAEALAAKDNKSLDPEKRKELHARFLALKGQIDPLKESITAADDMLKAKQFVRECDIALDSPARIPFNPDQVESDLAARRSDIQYGRVGQLRHFSLAGPNTLPQNLRENRRQALLSGLVLLRQTRMHQEWANSRLAAHGYDTSAKLASITPFQGEDGNSTGGYLVFPEFMATLIRLMEQYGVLRRLAYVVPMTSDTLNIPRRAGGTTVYYPEENTLITASAMAFDKIQLIAKKYAQLTLWSSELNEDSVISFTDLLVEEMAYQFAKAEDFNGAQGDGTSTYAGVVGFLQALVSGKNGITPTASIVTPAASNGTTTVAALAAATAANGGGLVTWNKLLGTLPVYAEGRAKFLMHKTVFWQGIAPIIEAAGGNIAMYLSSGIPLKFLGYDVEMMQAMPNAANISGASATPALKAVAVLGDVQSTVYMGDRRTPKVITSNERFMEYDQLGIQMSERVAITCVPGDSVDPVNQPGPMVVLTLPAT